MYIHAESDRVFAMHADIRNAIPGDHPSVLTDDYLASIGVFQAKIDEAGWWVAARPIDAKRKAKIDEIIAVSNARLSAGAPVGGGLHVALDTDSRSDLTAMATTATPAAAGVIPWPESYARGWISVENIRIPLATPGDGLSLAASVGPYYSAIVQRRRDLKDEVLAAEDTAALDAIDVAAGWPE